jgi:threonyl-tRNA synthetase
MNDSMNRFKLDFVGEKRKGKGRGVIHSFIYSSIDVVLTVVFKTPEGLLLQIVVGCLFGHRLG